VLSNPALGIAANVIWHLKNDKLAKDCVN